MRVGFDAGPLFSSYSGIGQYVRGLFPSMFGMAQGIEWVAFAPSDAGYSPYLPPSVSLKKTSSSWPLGRIRQDPDHPDIFHGTNFKSHNYGQNRTVLTIHDVWLARNPQFSKKLFGQAFSTWKLGFRAKRVSRVIAVSHFAAREIEEVLCIPSDHITVIYHGCSSEMFPDRDESNFQAMKSRLRLPALPYILFVGGAEPRKNHSVLFSAFSRSPKLRGSFCLVAVGDVHSRGISLASAAHALGITNSVYCPGLVSTEDLRVLYSHAESFVFPSLYEGFGIPLLEAMACGTPIITGNGSALPEVGGDAALYINPADPEHLGMELERLVGDPGLQEQLRNKGFERVKQFTWKRAAEQTLDLYRDVLGVS